jgi:hypothetical protein
VCHVYAQLGINFVPEDLRFWYHDDLTQPVLTVVIRDCPVRIRRYPREHIHWCPEGSHGWTEPLEKALSRLHMLQEPKRMTSRDVQCGHHPNSMARWGGVALSNDAMRTRARA